MPYFRKKPINIEARQFMSTASADDIIEWAREYSIEIHKRELVNWNGDPYSLLVIPTLEGPMEASHGDWIIRGVADEFYPCKPEIFRTSYDSVP